jgi:ubiquitin-like protein Pup
VPTHEKPRSSRGKYTGSERDDAAELPDATKASENKTALDDDIDAILDEIDDVLEENAEEFVRGFVQKGGQ